MMHLYFLAFSYLAMVSTTRTQSLLPSPDPWWLHKMLRSGYIYQDPQVAKWLAGILTSKTPFLEVLEEAADLKNQPGRRGRNLSLRQCVMPAEQSLPCRDLAPSPAVPTSVHKVRPGDIKVVAGLGDSLTAGMATGASSPLAILTEYRGLSFSMGGQGDWRECLTLPNILKMFNPSLQGASVSETVVGSGFTSGYNLAVSGSDSGDLVRQAWSLVRKMRRDPLIDFHQDWKMVTVLTGHNDLCRNTCNSTIGTFGFQGFRDGSPEKFFQNMRTVLDVLQGNLPRAFVNLVPMADVTMAHDLVHKPRVCDITHWTYCPCLFDNKFTDTKFSKTEMKALSASYMVKLDQLVSSGRYDTSPDFTVVLQPALLHGQLPTTYEPAWGRRLPDLSYLAPDCYHFSQKLQAMAARSLWNNLLQPVGQKATDWRREVPFLCPSSSRPYLATASQGQHGGESLAWDWSQQEADTKESASCPL